MSRTIALIDMDCFYAQVEQRDQPNLWGKPVAVVQHAREGAPGGIIALSYEARAFGVKRGMMIKEAKTLCSDLELCFVPQGEHIDKADIQKYRDASAEVFEVLFTADHRITVERASVDEAFLDMSTYANEMIAEIESINGCIDKWLAEFETYFPSTHLATGLDKNVENAENYEYDRELTFKKWLDGECRSDISQLRLAIAAEKVEQIRKDIRDKTQFYCSGGIGVNKMIAKLVCGRHKPRQQTVIPSRFIPEIFRFTQIEDVRMLGGKLGRSIQKTFSISTMAELAEKSYDDLFARFPGHARWMFQLAKGVDDEPVKLRSTQTSIAVSKNFPGKNALITVSEVRRWVEGLSKELSKRLLNDRFQNNRTAENVAVGLVNPSRSSSTLKIRSYESAALFEMIWDSIKNSNKGRAEDNEWYPPILNIYLSASRFTDGVTGSLQSIKQCIEDMARRKAGTYVKPSTPIRSEAIPSTSRGNDNDIEIIDLDSNPNSCDIPTTSNSNGLPHQIDKDGWPIVDFSKLDDNPTIIAKPDVINIGDVQVSKQVYKELPAFIRAELDLERKFAEAKKQVSKPIPQKKEAKNKPAAPKKRPPKAIKEEPPAKRIDSFFKKRS